MILTKHELTSWLTSVREDICNRSGGYPHSLPGKFALRVNFYCFSLLFVASKGFGSWAPAAFLGSLRVLQHVWGTRSGLKSTRRVLGEYLNVFGEFRNVLHENPRRIFTDVCGKFPAMLAGSFRGIFFLFSWDNRKGGCVMSTVKLQEDLQDLEFQIVFQKAMVRGIGSQWVKDLFFVFKMTQLITSESLSRLLLGSPRIYIRTPSTSSMCITRPGSWTIWRWRCCCVTSAYSRGHNLQQTVCLHGCPPNTSCVSQFLAHPRFIGFLTVFKWKKHIVSIASIVWHVSLVHLRCGRELVRLHNTSSTPWMSISFNPSLLELRWFN